MDHRQWRAPVAAGLFVLALSMAGTAGNGATSASAGLVGQETPTSEFPELPSPGKKCRIGDNFYFIYGFTEKPRMGTAILRIRIFDQDGDRTTELTVLGRSDMPAMPGAHDSGDREFKLNRKGDYLLPVDIVMPGEWEVKLTFRRGEDVLFRGAFRFDV